MTIIDNILIQSFKALRRIMTLLKIIFCIISHVFLSEGFLKTFTFHNGFSIQSHSIKTNEATSEVGCASFCASFDDCGGFKTVYLEIRRFHCTLYINIFDITNGAGNSFVDPGKRIT